MNHLLFNGNPLRFWGVHVPAMFQPLIPRTLIKNLDDSLQAQFAKQTNLLNQKTTQNHPKASKHSDFFGENLFFFVVASHSPRFLLRTVPPGPFTPVGNPNQTRGVENGSSRISTRSGVATLRRDSPNHPRVSGGKKDSSRKYDQRWVM